MPTSDSNRSRRGVNATLSQPQQRQPWLWRAPNLICGSIQFFCFLEFASQAVQFGLLIERRAGAALARWIAEALARVHKFRHRVGPRAVKLRDLGAVNHALSAMSHEVGLRCAPRAQRRRPFLRSVEIEDFAARADDAAIDVAHNEGRRVSSRHAHHDLVEQRETFG